MKSRDQRFRQRYNASPLTLEIRPVNWFGVGGKIHKAVGRNFSIGGISIISPLKLKVGKRLLASLSTANHSLHSVPVTVLRIEEQKDDYIYALKFNMGELSDIASHSAYSVLKQLEESLKG